MKKIILSLIIGALTLNSCQNDNNDEISKIENLNNDLNFQKLIKNNLSFNYKIINSNNKNLIKQIEKNDIEQMSKNLNYKNTKDLTNDINSQFELINYIIANYNVQNYNEQELKQLIINEINEIENLKDSSSKADPAGCRRKFRNDLIIITAAAVAGHIACGTVDITVVLGGICHGAVIVTQAAASDNAAMELQNCLN